jgi:hypothetical protein
MARLHPLWERILIALFVATIAIPGLATVAGIDRPTSRSENRELAPFPAMPTDLASLRAFPDAFTRYFEDNFSFRGHLVQWQAAFRFRQLRVSPSPTVIAGRDGWLFYADDGAIEDFSDARPFTATELEAWRLTLEHTRDWLAERNVRYLFVIAPDKHVIYPDLLPGTLHRLHDESRIDQLVEYLQQRSTVTVLDLRPALRAARDRDRLYHRTDTHWNDIGAWVGYRQIIDRLGIAGLQPAPRSAFTEHNVVTPGMDLAGMIGLKDVLTEDDLVLVPRQPRAARVIEPTHADPSLMYDRVVTEQANRALPRAVVFRDSFASALIPFLSEHFSRAVYLWQNNFDPATIEIEHPDVVIQEWVGRHLNNQWPYDAVADMRPKPPSSRNRSRVPLGRVDEDQTAAQLLVAFLPQAERVDTLRQIARHDHAPGQVALGRRELLFVLGRRERQRQHRDVAARLDAIERVDDHRVRSRHERRQRHLPENIGVTAGHDHQRRFASQRRGRFVAGQVDGALQHLLEQRTVAIEAWPLRLQKVLVRRRRERHPG